CHATGFYPSEVNILWQKDGPFQHEDVETGHTLPNGDGTFQKSVLLTVKPEEWKNNKYHCVVQVSGINKDFIKDLTESEIQTNRAVVKVLIQTSRLKLQRATTINSCTVTRKNSLVGLEET
uniref:Ig-like domain-containing protein n=1 Tax=Esox lucius TaxID=8010 RepID=A0A6Q2WYJ3_ESOLU